MHQRLKRLRPTPSMAVALTALTVALGGTSYAAVSLATHSVTTSKIAPQAVSVSKIKTHAVSRGKIRAGAVSPSKLSVTVQRQLAASGPTGPAGPTGAAGAQGRDGTAVAYGSFTGDGGVRAGSAFGLSGLSVNHAGAGVYCLSGLTVKLENVQATIDAAGAPAGATVAATLHDFPTCPAGTQIEVDTFQPVATGGAEAANVPFAIAVN